MIYRLLGELEIGEDGRLLDLPGGPTLIVLAALLVNANRRMSKTELIRAAWGNDDVDEAQLYKRVKVVRDLLAEIGQGGDLKTHPRFGYEMRVAEADVDALLFQRLVREADEAGAEHRTEDEIGSPAAGAAAVAGPASAVERAERCVPPGDRRPGAAAQAGRGAAVRPGARPRPSRARPGRADADGRLLPADRRLCEQLMLAEYRCGHLADVASAYERYRETLAEETGGEPDTLLRNFHFAVARGDARAIAAAESALAKRTGTPAAVHRPGASGAGRSAPAASGHRDLVGRADLAAEVSWLLRRRNPVRRCRWW